MIDVNGAAQLFVERRKNSVSMKSLFSYSSAPILVWDANFTIIRFNRAFELLTGRPFHQIFGKSLLELFPYEQIDQTLDLISATYDGERWKSHNRVLKMVRFLNL